MKGFTKKDLQNGDVVLKRNGAVEIVMLPLGTLICKAGGYNSLSDKGEDLTGQYSAANDIVKVRRPRIESECRFDAFTLELGELVYDRYAAEGIKLGDKVRVIDSGCNYSTYRSWFKRNAPALEDLYCQSCKDGDEGIVLVKASHHLSDDRTLVACANSEGKVFLIEENGIELVKEKENG